MGVFSGEQAQDSVALGGGEALGRHRESASRPVERVVPAASMAEGVLLHSSSALIEGLVRDPHHMGQG